MRYGAAAGVSYMQAEASYVHTSADMHAFFAGRQLHQKLYPGA